MTARPDRLIADIIACARCGDEHEKLVFNRRFSPIQIGGVLFTYRALCPSNGDVIHMRVASDGERVQA